MSEGDDLGTELELEAEQRRNDLGPAPVSVHEESDALLAAAQLLPSDSDTGDDVSIYQLKWVEWEEGFVPIIVQNENGPCPLLALCNVLILRKRIKITPGQTAVSSTYLTDLLGTYLLESHKTHQLSDGEKANLEQNIQDTMAIFPKLQTGLDVNVKFNSVIGFEFTRETGVFDLLGVPLCHGWVVDPQSLEWYGVVQDLSYNQLVEMVINNSSSENQKLMEEALLGEQFLASTATQLTYHGIFELNSAISEGELCVFFRNNHFNTLMKRKGHLLTLVSDLGFLNEMSYIWQTLTDVDGGGEFLDADFRLAPHSHMQQNREESVPRAAAVTPTTDQPTEVESNDDIVEEMPVDPESDFQTALRLQEEEYNDTHTEEHRSSTTLPLAATGGPSGGTTTQEEQLDQQLAAQLQSEDFVPPPNTSEEYEKAALSQRSEDSGTHCVVL